jgi:hypothetical protein
MDAEATVPWITIASYSGLCAEVEADLLVANLQGGDIPAVRLPKQPLGMFVTKICVPSIMPIQVMVPADREAEARELLDEQPRQTVPAAVRPVVQWYLAALVVTAIVGGPLSRSIGGSGVLASLCFALTVIAGVMLIVSELRLVAAVQRERPGRPGLGIVIATVVAVGAVCFVLVYLLGMADDGRPPTVNRTCMATGILLGYTVLTALLLQRARARGTAEEPDDNGGFLDKDS